MSTDCNYLPVYYTQSVSIHKEKRGLKMGKSEEKNVCHKDLSQEPSLIVNDHVAPPLT